MINTIKEGGIDEITKEDIWSGLANAITGGIVVKAGLNPNVGKSMFSLNSNIRDRINQNSRDIVRILRESAIKAGIEAPIIFSNIYLSNKLDILMYEENLVSQMTNASIGTAMLVAVSGSYKATKGIATRGKPIKTKDIQKLAKDKENKITKKPETDTDTVSYTAQQIIEGRDSDLKDLLLTPEALKLKNQSELDFEKTYKDPTKRDLTEQEVATNAEAVKKFYDTELNEILNLSAKKGLLTVQNSTVKYIQRVDDRWFITQFIRESLINSGAKDLETIQQSEELRTRFLSKAAEDGYVKNRKEAIALLKQTEERFYKTSPARFLLQQINNATYGIKKHINTVLNFRLPGSTRKPNPSPVVTGNEFSKDFISFGVLLSKLEEIQKARTIKTLRLTQHASNSAKAIRKAVDESKMKIKQVRDIWGFYKQTLEVPDIASLPKAEEHLDYAIGLFEKRNGIALDKNVKDILKSSLQSVAKDEINLVKVMAQGQPKGSSESITQHRRIDGEKLTDDKEEALKNAIIKKDREDYNKRQQDKTAKEEEDIRLKESSNLQLEALSKTDKYLSFVNSAIATKGLPKKILNLLKKITGATEKPETETKTEASPLEDTETKTEASPLEDTETKTETKTETRQKHHH